MECCFCWVRTSNVLNLAFPFSSSHFGFCVLLVRTHLSRFFSSVSKSFQSAGTGRSTSFKLVTSTVVGQVAGSWTKCRILFFTSDCQVACVTSTISLASGAEALVGHETSIVLVRRVSGVVQQAAAVVEVRHQGSAVGSGHCFPRISRTWDATGAHLLVPLLLLFWLL